MGMLTGAVKYALLGLGIAYCVNYCSHDVRPAQDRGGIEERADDAAKQPGTAGQPACPLKDGKSASMMLYLNSLSERERILLAHKAIDFAGKEARMEMLEKLIKEDDSAIPYMIKHYGKAMAIKGYEIIAK